MSTNAQKYNRSGYDRLYQQLIQADLFDVNAGFVMEEIKHTTALHIS